MPNSRIRPVVVFQVSDEWHDQYGGSRQSKEYWHARREFLASYHFSEDKLSCTFKDKLKRIASDLHHRLMCRPRLPMTMTRLRFGFGFGIRSRVITCFSPWLNG